MTGIRRILAPTDFSAVSNRALAHAVEIARASKATLIVTHILAPIVPLIGDGYVPPATYTELEVAARRAGQRRLDATVARVVKAGVKAAGLLLEGVAADRIARAARKERADLIVMGTRGRSGLSRFLLGSVAQRVLTLAPCAVLTVRG
jgi:nucleotide-binding universal stress UspA family protein